MIPLVLRGTRLFLPGTVAAAVLMTIALPASAADLKKLADELVNHTEQQAAGDGDLDGDGRADVSAQPGEKADIRRATAVDALDASRATEGQDLDEAPANRRAAKVDAGDAPGAKQGGQEGGPDAAGGHRRAGDPIPGIDITVNQGR